MGDVVGWDPDALRAIIELSRRDQSQALRSFRAIYQIISARPGEIRKLEGSHDRWRLRVGDWRVIYRRTEYGFQVAAVVNRSDAYR